MNQSEIVLESPDMNPQDRDGRQFYLASNSPRRKELLSLIGIAFQLLPAQVDETPLPGEDGIAYVERVASSKALAASQLAGAGSVIIAADTAVVNRQGEGMPEILGKPGTPAVAVEMLRSLRGHTHQVYTAITIHSNQDGIRLADLCTTDVPMRNYSDGEIEAYIASGDPMDKAGAYAIQHAGFHPVDHLEGCFANVMGLPLCHLARNLVLIGIQPSENVPRACQVALNYNCPVYQLILKDSALNLAQN